MLHLTDKNRFLLGLGIVLAGGFLAVASFGFLASRQSIRAGISEQSLPLTSDNIYSDIQKDLIRPVIVSSMMASDPLLRKWLLEGERDPEYIKRYLKNIRREYGAANSFLVSEHSRQYYTDAGAMKAVSEAVPRDGWYFRVRQMQDPYEINVDPDEFNQDAVTLFVNYKVIDEQGRYLGCTGVGLTSAAIANNIDRHEGAFQRHVHLVDRNGRSLLAGKSIPGANRSLRDTPGLADVADRILAGNTTPRTSEYRKGISLILVNSRYIPELSAFLVVEQAEDPGIRGIQHTYLFNLVVSFVFSMIALALVNLLVRRYQTKIETLAREATENAARELELARAQQDFVAMISHEFGTPLAIIDAALHGLRHGDRDLPPDEASRWTKIHRASRRLRELMGNYLTVDRLRQADAGLSFSPVDIFALANRVGWRAEWPVMEIDLPDTRAVVLGDAELLGILFFNLINNATKYSEERSAIQIEGVATNDRVEISVRDHGTGIAPEDLSRVFEKYYRAKNNPTGGAGLGLYVVKQIADLHGGAVTVESVVGQGSCFRVSLPRLP